MATTRVPVRAYIDGALPDVSVRSGAPAVHRVTVTHDVPRTEHGTGTVLPFLLGRLEMIIRPGTPVLVLRGRLPMTETEEASLHARRRWGRVASWTSFAVLVVAAWSAFSYAPVVAVVALVGIAGGVSTLVATRRAWPRAVLDETGEWVVLHRVHPAFVAAVERP